jgi:hypothetical protein
MRVKVFDLSEIVTLEISEDAARLARTIATHTGRDLKEILSEWIDRSAADAPVENLPDEQVLALCDAMMSDEDQAALSGLLSAQQENQLDLAGRVALDKLMQIYRRSLVRKSEALKVAVQRGLRPSLG